MVLICTAMPQQLRDGLLGSLVGVFNGQDVLDVYQATDGAQPFQCAHFSWYNHYTTQVCYL